MGVVMSSRYTNEEAKDIAGVGDFSSARSRNGGRLSWCRRCIVILHSSRGDLSFTNGSADLCPLRLGEGQLLDDQVKEVRVHLPRCTDIPREVPLSQQTQSSRKKASLAAEK